MYLNKKVGFFMMCAAVSAFTGCASEKPVAYSGIASASYLQTNVDDKTGRIPYTYSRQVNWRSYTGVIVDPVEIYRGSDNQFGDMKDEDKLDLANDMQKTFAERLGKRFAASNQPGRGTLRVKLILTGAETTTPFLGQFVHFDIGGNVYNGVAAAAGGKSAFGGSVSFAVEVYDSASGQLLNAYVSKQYPNAMNLAASFGSLGAARTGIDKGADALLARLQ
ncbi:DUF3313 domain-containing protein [Trinickia dinghuensis]|uniref:DUF3313 domain-containing protein n=1 Tax=Trinickia dinghuensis TaxID=2291023 RepID=A0A3D8K764_9BURK|nr:DUF3313 domain-containing protein [Trinickia dinghuensis]RDV00913.1 DUF3313 domain-containing protein [Trinickia dinghuensis]